MNGKFIKVTVLACLLVLPLSLFSKEFPFSEGATSEGYELDQKLEAKYALFTEDASPVDAEKFSRILYEISPLPEEEVLYSASDLAKAWNNTGIEAVKAIKKAAAKLDGLGFELVSAWYLDGIFYRIPYSELKKHVDAKNKFTRLFKEDSTIKVSDARYVFLIQSKTDHKCEQDGSSSKVVAGIITTTKASNETNDYTVTGEKQLTNSFITYLDKEGCLKNASPCGEIVERVSID